jgi:hypothetical protein
MRVKIAYTVELEEVEREVSEILCRAVSNIDKAYQELTDIQNQLETGTDDIEAKLNSLHLVRTKMMKADQILEDCYSILQGFEETKKKLEEVKDEIQNR